MSLLDSNNFPHTASATRRTVSLDDLGGPSSTFPTTLFSGTKCWAQPVSDSEKKEFDKMGIQITNKIYFLSKVDLVYGDELTVVNPLTSTTLKFEIRSRAESDASVGLGILYRVYGEISTTGSAGEIS